MKDKGEAEWCVEEYRGFVSGIGKDEKCADPKEWQRVSRELCEALSGVGFVYLSNHGIPDEQVRHTDGQTNRQTQEH
ncbi:hypothetical protein E2C01_048725 [Portunus trituberculatus]|uniref:Non-haem dioxygenase N-terminal domain-containing protein n=1 Tax=Portunus trituberculatus TaxID=210409 RepID=A0A5B7GAX9_PORTR|nr:hypothetical protein [Portunus trituberculatus]